MEKLSKLRVCPHPGQNPKRSLAYRQETLLGKVTTSGVSLENLKSFLVKIARLKFVNLVNRVECRLRLSYTTGKLMTPRQLSINRSVSSSDPSEKTCARLLRISLSEFCWLQVFGHCQTVNKLNRTTFTRLMVFILIAIALSA